MTTDEDHEFAALESYIRDQLADAAETYASLADLDNYLKSVMETRTRSR